MISNCGRGQLLLRFQVVGKTSVTHTLSIGGAKRSAKLLRVMKGGVAFLD
jgi:hypothetical protein